MHIKSYTYKLIMLIVLGVCDCTIFLQEANAYTANTGKQNLLDVKSEINRLKYEARQMTDNLPQEEMRKCFLEKFDNTLADKEFQRKIGICLEVEESADNSMSASVDILKCQVLRANLVSESLKAAQNCKKPYKSKIDW